MPTSNDPVYARIISSDAVNLEGKFEFGPGHPTWRLDTEKFLRQYLKTYRSFVGTSLQTIRSDIHVSTPSQSASAKEIPVIDDLPPFS
jgi:hypothetical protein